MKNFLSIAGLVLASASVNALSIKTIINDSPQNAFIIAYTKPELYKPLEPVDLSKSFIGFEEAVYPVQSSVFLLTRNSIVRQADTSGPLKITNHDCVIVTTSKGQKDITFDAKTLKPINDIASLIIEKDGTVTVIKGIDNL